MTGRALHRDEDGTAVREWHTSAALAPRALPTDTSVRFLLLLAAVVAASLYLYDALWFVLRGETFLDVVARCGLDVGGLAAGSVSATTTELATQAECRSGVAREQSAFAVAGTVMVLVVAYCAYRLMPRWRVRRAGLAPPDPVDGRALDEAVSELSAEAGLERRPEVLVDAANPSVQAFVLGTAGRPLLGVTGGLVVQQVLDPPAFRAVLRHELAHLANRDVPWTYYTVAVWWSFVVLALAPVIAVFAVADPRYVLRLGWRTVALALLVLLVRNAVLRAREAYADARAAEWGSGRDLDRLMTSAPGRSERWPVHRRLLSRHPSPQARRRLLADPDGLFVADPMIALFAGVATATTFVSFQSVATLVLPSATGVWAAALLVAPLLAAVLCVGAWRAGLRSSVRGARQAVAGPLAVGAGLGLALGPLLSFQAAAGGVVDGLSGAVGYVVWAFGAGALAGLLARYVTDTGRIAVRTALLSPSPRSLLLLHGVAVTGATAALLAYGHLGLLVLSSAGPAAALQSVALWAYLPAWFGDGGSALLAVLVLLAMPAVVVWVQRARQPASSEPGTWAWREQPPPAVPAPMAPDVTTALAVAALVGVAAAAWHVLARFVGVAALDPGVWRSDAYEVSLGTGTAVLVVVAVVVGAGAAAVLLPRRWWALGLLGGLTTLGTAGAGILTAQVAAGCGLLPRAGPFDCRPPRGGELTSVVLQPLVLAAVWSVLAVALVGVVRSLPPRGGGPGRPLVVGLAAAALLAVPGLGTLATVAGTTVTTVPGPGYDVALPPLWTATPAEDGVPLFATVDERVRVDLRPVAEALPPTDLEQLEVGGTRAWLVDERSEGGLVLRSYDLSAPPGPYRLRVLGTPRALDAAADEELSDLLSSVTWTTG